MVKITARIGGMLCGMCESHVSGVIRRAFPIRKVTSSHSRGHTEILPEDDISDEALAADFAPTGYVLLSAEHIPVQKKGWFRQ